MADRSSIEWTDATWTAIRARNVKTLKVGWHCEHKSEACRNCYAESRATSTTATSTWCLIPSRSKNRSPAPCKRALGRKLLGIDDGGKTVWMELVGKRAAGAELDGVEHRAMPA